MWRMHGKKYLSSRRKQRQRQSYLCVMLSLTPVMIFIVINFWMDIWTIDYTDAYRQMVFRDDCMQLTLQMENYRTAKGFLPENLEQFGPVYIGDDFEKVYCFDTSGVWHTWFEYFRYADGTFVLMNRKYGIRYVSSADSSAFIYYDKQQGKNIVEFVRR